MEFEGEIADQAESIDSEDEPIDQLEEMSIH